MSKWIFSLLFFVSFFIVGNAQTNSSWSDDDKEAFNAQLDSIQAEIDGEPYSQSKPEPVVEYNEDADNDEVITYEDDDYDSEEAAKEYKDYASDYQPELREVDEKEWKRIKKDKRFNYKKKKPEKKKKKKKRRDPWFDGLGDFFNTAAFKYFLYVLLALFLGYVIYLFVKNNDLSFRRNVKDDEIEPEAPWEDVQQFEDWELALQDALKQKNYRLATRIYYLHTLHLLDRNQQIQYRDDKTNWYYVQKLFGKDLHDDFKGLTQSFDYIWYGEYQIDQQQFGVLEKQFKSFHYRIN
jgi:hypothetical protein